jgi:hypothetical protein
MLTLEKDESFSLTAYVQSPGYQTIALKGYLLERRADGVYAAPLIPQLFYGVDGKQLGPSWRQYIPAAGSQVILSRMAGKPEVPREELFWRKISEVPRVEEKPPEIKEVALPAYAPWLIIISAFAIVGLIIWLSRKT